MHILLISTLPEVHGLFDLRHHYPTSERGHGGRTDPGATALPGGDVAATFTEIDPGRSGALDGLSAMGGERGPVVAHLTGTSASMLRMSDELRAGGIPFVYSPMIPSYPSRVARLAGWVTGRANPPARDVRIASSIANAAATVVADSAAAETALRRDVGVPAVKMVTVPTPRSTLHSPAGPGDPGSRSPTGVKGFGNFALAICDEVTPEWNVLRFLFAMEKLNAAAVVIAAKSDSRYARECADRAALNERVKFLTWERGNAQAIAGALAATTATVVVDPSLRGIGGALAREYSLRGVPSVVSGAWVGAAAPADGLYTFEPSSWELLNHAVTCAFNKAAAGTPERPGTDELAEWNAETAGALRRLYARAAGV